MKKVALVFALAVIAPSILLAWLAARSLQDQELAMAQQRLAFHQGLADAKAASIARHLDATRNAFADHVENLLKAAPPREAASQFDSRLRAAWPLAEIGFVVSLDGEVIEPSLFAGAQARKFRLENDRFLSADETVEVYWNSPKGPVNLGQLDKKEEEARARKSAAKGLESGNETSPVASSATNFRQLVGDDMEGIFARFLQDRLHVMFWHRAADDPRLVFGAQVNLARLAGELGRYVELDGDLTNEVRVALVDDAGKRVASSHQIFRTATATNASDDWTRPFVSAEIGEALPHWEVAVQLLDPAKAGRSAATLRLTLALMIGLLVLAIAVGSWLIVADLRRQLTLARQKTDFVSNVSHELKTPLTSIRMFSEMLAEGRVQDEDKRRQFLGIITAETSRLTRLINNVLDFARLERGEKQYQFEPCDLSALTRSVTESYRLNLEAGGFGLTVRLPEVPVNIRCDGDAIAQIIVNLLSNAEKYSGHARHIFVEVQTVRDGAEVRVLDRGPGVPKGCEERIFEQFFRAHDSLASGIQGSGLGLTLARKIARAHGGDVTYERIEGGGSCFTLRLPLDARVGADGAEDGKVSQPG